MPTTQTVVPQGTYGPGTTLFGPNVVPVTLTGYRIEVDRALFTDPATAILMWLDFSLDAGVSWLGFPVPDEVFGALGLTPEAITAYSSVGDRGSLSYPPISPKTGQPIPILLENLGAPGAGNTLRRVRGGIKVKGSVTTSMKLITFP